MNTGLLSLGTHLPEHVIDNATIAEWTGAPRAGWRSAPASSNGATAPRAPRPPRSPTGRRTTHWTDCRSCGGSCSTSSSPPPPPDQPQPSTAAILQDRLGLPGVPAFDVNAVCSGFLYGLAVADSLLATRTPGGTALVVGADIYSTQMDRTDRRTVSLFGDGSRRRGPGPRTRGIRHPARPPRRRRRAPRVRRGRG
ncbi:hypothetical protein GCM10020000_29640 [Streptomyces olivoverticillatus]